MKWSFLLSLSLSLSIIAFVFCFFFFIISKYFILAGTNAYLPEFFFFSHENNVMWVHNASDTDEKHRKTTPTYLCSQQSQWQSLFNKWCVFSTNAVLLFIATFFSAAFCLHFSHEAWIYEVCILELITRARKYNSLVICIHYTLQMHYCILLN